MISAINSNFDKLEVAANLALSKANNAVNALGTALDVNSQRLMNLTAPQNPTDAARLVDITGVSAPAELPNITAVSTITALRNLSYAGLSSGVPVNLLGYYAAGDAGGGEFVWDSASSATDDGGLVINPTGNAGAGRWLRVVENSIYAVEMWGAKSESGFDNTPRWQAAIDALTADANYSFRDGALGYGNTTGATLTFSAGSWDFISLHPSASDRMLWMKKPLNIVGAGADRSHIRAKYASVKTWLVAEPASGGYAVGGSITHFSLHGGLGGVWQNGIKVTATYPSAWDGFVVANFLIFEVKDGIKLDGTGGPTVYGCVVGPGKVLSIAAGGAGLHDVSTAYNCYENVDVYEDITIAGAYCFLMSASFNSILSNVRWQGVAVLDGPFGTISGCAAEGGYDFSAGSNVAINLQRWATIDGLTVNNVGNANISSIVRTSAVLATVTTSVPHGLSTGVNDSITISGAAPAAYNRSTIATVTSPTTFTYPLASDPVVNATTVGWFAATSGPKSMYGIIVGGTGVDIDSVSFVGKQPGRPFGIQSGATGTGVNVRCSVTPSIDPATETAAADWRGFRISDSSTLTEYGWEVRGVTTLPTARDQARGIVRHVLSGTGVLDRTVVCRKDAADAYAWVDLF